MASVCGHCKFMNDATDFRITQQTVEPKTQTSIFALHCTACVTWTSVSVTWLICLAMLSTVFIVAAQPCSVNPCQNGGTCIRMGHLFRCNCRPGYYGYRCQFAHGTMITFLYVWFWFVVHRHLFVWVWDRSWVFFVAEFFAMVIFDSRGISWNVPGENTKTDIFTVFCQQEIRDVEWTWTAFWSWCNSKRGRSDINRDLL